MSSEVRDLARGRWPSIHLALGVLEQYLRDQHGPCPVCGGTDRFRYDNKEGRGTYFCNQCGAGDGIDLLMKFRGWSFRETASAVRGVLGDTCREHKGREYKLESKAAADHKAHCNRLWRDSRPVLAGDETDTYLKARGLDLLTYPGDLRTCARCWCGRDARGNNQYFPAMIAMVRDQDGRPVTLHRTFLLDGAKAPVQNPRRLMPGSLPEGSAVRLSDGAPVLGIAEGIETAMAASKIFDMPVWAALNATRLKTWSPPEGVGAVVVFADNDVSETGQRAAAVLQNRLRARGLGVGIELPFQKNTDWADVWAGTNLLAATSRDREGGESDGRT